MIDERIDLDKHIGLSTYRGKYFVRFKSGSVQRWGATQVAMGRDYYTLTPVMWRKAAKTTKYPHPEGSETKSPGTTYYFAKESDAKAAGEQFLSNLQTKGVKL